MVNLHDVKKWNRNRQIILRRIAHGSKINIKHTLVKKKLYIRVIYVISLEIRISCIGKVDRQ